MKLNYDYNISKINLIVLKFLYIASVVLLVGALVESEGSTSTGTIYVLAFAVIFSTIMYFMKIDHKVKAIILICILPLAAITKAFLMGSNILTYYVVIGSIILTGM
ncbi:MAG TPA: hypothetical protein DEP72_07200, partial [Clostridiales bacterium]|nr:hypothetical protein [Clostridiales bacterium]